MIKTKSKIVNITLNVAIYFFLILFLWILVGNLFSPDKPLFHLFVNPKKIIETEICSFVSPAGWELNCYDNYNGIDKTNIAVVSKPILDSQKKEHYSYASGSIIILKYHKKNYMLEVGKSKMGYLVQSQPETELFKKIIDGKEASFWRFKGYKCLPAFVKNVKSDDTIYDDKYESVSIVWMGDSFGFEGFFWGFPEDEEVFWKTIESIKWKNGTQN